MTVPIREAPSRSSWHPTPLSRRGTSNWRWWSMDGARATPSQPRCRSDQCVSLASGGAGVWRPPTAAVPAVPWARQLSLRQASRRCVFGGGAWRVTDAAVRVGQTVPTALRQRGRPWRPTPLAAAPRRHRCRPLCYEVRRLARRGRRRVAPQRRVGGAAGTVVASPPDPPPPLWGVGRLRPARSPGCVAHTTRCGARRRAGAAPTVPFPGGNCRRRWTVARRRADGDAPTTGCLHWVGRPLCPHFPPPVSLAVVRPPAATPHH